MQHKRKRSYGSGSLFDRNGKWVGQFRVDGRQVKRVLGPKRIPGTRDGLTKTQAEARLRKLMQEMFATPPISERVTVQEAGEAYIDHLELMGRRSTTIRDYRIILARHLVPAFGEKPLDRIRPDEVGSLVGRKLRSGLAPSTIHHQLNVLSGLFKFAVKRGWATQNPVPLVDRPKAAGPNPDIRYLDRGELEALIRKVPDDKLGAMERVLYRTAAISGLRQGELAGLRWGDVDWVAGVIRVRRTFTRGEFAVPKSRRSSRAVPMADQVAAELDRHYQRSAYTADADLVFAHPETGNPYDASKMRKRFQHAAEAAGLGRVTFHNLRHTFGTQMAAAGAPLRALQEWMGHRDYRTTAIYADYAPDPSQGKRWAEQAFGVGTKSGTNLSESQGNSDSPNPHSYADSDSAP